MIWGYFNNRKEKIDYAKKIKLIIVSATLRVIKSEHFN